MATNRREYGKIMGKSTGPHDQNYPFCAGPECWCYDCSIDSVEDSVLNYTIDKAHLYAKYQKTLFLSNYNMEIIMNNTNDDDSKRREDYKNLFNTTTNNNASIDNHIRKISSHTIQSDNTALETLQSYIRWCWLFKYGRNNMGKYNSMRRVFDHMSSYVFNPKGNVEKEKEYHFDETILLFQPYLDATNEKDLNILKNEAESLGFQFRYQKNIPYRDHDAWLIIIVGPRLPLEIVVDWVLNNINK